MLKQIVLDCCKGEKKDCDKISTGMRCMFQEYFSLVTVL